MTSRAPLRRFHISHMPDPVQPAQPKSQRVVIALILVSVSICSGVFLHRLTRLDGVEWNPLINTSQLSGTWRDAATTLMIDSDGLYVCDGPNCNDLAESGQWMFDGNFRVTFRPTTGSTVVRRVAVRDDALHFVSGAEKADPDEWDPRFTFSRSASMRAEVIGHQ